MENWSVFLFQIVFNMRTVIVCLQVNIDFEFQVVSDDSVVELFGFLQDLYFMVTYTIFKFKSIIRKY